MTMDADGLGSTFFEFLSFELEYEIEIMKVKRCFMFNMSGSL